MDTDLENVLNGLYHSPRYKLIVRINENDVDGILIIDRTGELLACTNPASFIPSFLDADGFQPRAM
jgi:hypothetical protein